MNYEQIAKIKKQREILRQRIKSDINKLASMGHISNFQATHMVLDKLITEVDNSVKMYGGLKQDQWIGNMAETYLESTTAIVTGVQETAKPEPEAHYTQGAIIQSNPGWQSYTWAGYGPLTKAQYDELNLLPGGHKTNLLAAKFESYNKTYGFPKNNITGQVHDTIIIDDPSPVFSKVQGKPDNWTYTIVSDMKCPPSWGAQYKGMKLNEYLDATIVKKEGWHVCEAEQPLVKLHYVPGLAAYKLIPRPKAKNMMTMEKANLILKEEYAKQGYVSPTEYVESQKLPATYNYGTIKMSNQVKAIHDSIWSPDATHQAHVEAHKAAMKKGKSNFAKAVEAEMLEATAQSMNETEKVICGPPYEQFAVVGKNGQYINLIVDSWYTGQTLNNLLGVLPSKLKAPEGHVWVYHPTKDLAKCVKETHKTVIHEQAPWDWNYGDQVQEYGDSF